jgi:hypothetical protein
MICLILMGGLCFGGHHLKAEADDFGMGRTYRVAAEHYSVETAVTDVIDMHDFARSPKACADDVCIRYHKHCTPKDKGITCAYRVVWQGVVPDGLITITADSAEGLAAAEQEVALAIDRPGGKTVQLPFAAMTAASRDETPPECAGGDFAACDPP